MPERGGEPLLPPAPPLFRAASAAVAPSASVPEPLPRAPAADSVPIPRWKGADTPLCSTGNPMPRLDTGGGLTGGGLAGGADDLMNEFPAREESIEPRDDTGHRLLLSTPRRSRSLEERRGDSGLPGGGAWRDDLPAGVLSSTALGEGDGRHLPPPLPPTPPFSSSSSS